MIIQSFDPDEDITPEQAYQYVPKMQRIILKMNINIWLSHILKQTISIHLNCLVIIKLLNFDFKDTSLATFYNSKAT